MASPTHESHKLKATWHGEFPTRVKTEVMGDKVDVKPGASVMVSPEMGRDLNRERLWEVEGFAWTPLKDETKRKAKSEEGAKKDVK